MMSRDSVFRGLVAGLILVAWFVPNVALATEPPSKTDETSSEVVEAAPSQWPPRYQDRRFSEDWRPTDWKAFDLAGLPWSDRIKLVPLNKSRSVWASFGGQIRLRSVGLGRPDFGGSETQTVNTGTGRIRAFAGFQFGNLLRVYAEGIFSETITEADGITLPGSLTNPHPAFLNLFAEAQTGALGGWESSVWVGRRELEFGHQRLVSPQNWLNTRRSFQGLGGQLSSGDRTLRAFFVHPVIVVPEGGISRDQDTEFWGIFFSNREEFFGVASGYAQSLTRPTRGFWETYLLGLHRQDVTFVQGTADEDRYTVGLLSYGPYNRTPFDAEVEGNVQFGRFGSDNILAWSLTAQGAVTPRGWWGNPRFWMSFDYASGDSDPEDNKLETYDPLYPLGQNFFGIHGLFDRRNLVAISVNADFIPIPRFAVRASLFGLWRAETEDGVYRTGGAILRPPGGSEARYIGFQAQVVGGYQFNRSLLIGGVVNWLSPGRFIEETQDNPVHDFRLLTLLMQWTF